MPMRMWISHGAIAVLGGCGLTAGTADYAMTDQAMLDPTAQDPPAQSIPRCPDPTTDCTSTNGSGVYVEEGGDIGIDAPDAKIRFMITTFVNHGSSVTVRGRYQESGGDDPMWQWAEGTVDSADHGDATGLGVISVSEDSTRPTWTLADPAAPDTPTLVTGDQIPQLKLHVTLLTLTRIPVRVVLDFDGPDAEIPDMDHIRGVPEHAPHPVLQAYTLRWRPDGGVVLGTTPYCVRSSETGGGEDHVVFQGGIAVDPITGRVTRDPSFVTMSCSTGAIAKAHSWGYAYVDQHDGLFFDGFYYDAAIQMKRASYCANWSHYTIAGTKIGIQDSSTINADQGSFATLEARWSPAGAICVTARNERHPELHFNGRCNGTTKPTCPTSRGFPELADYRIPEPAAR